MMLLVKIELARYHVEPQSVFLPAKINYTGDDPD